MVTAGLKQPVNRPIYFNSIHGQILQADKHQLEPEKLMSPRSTSFPERRLPHRSVFYIRMSLNILLLPSEYRGKIAHEHALSHCVQELGPQLSFLACVRFPNSTLPIFTSI